MAALCASCGAKKSHSIHLKALGLPGGHPYLDASKAGLKPVSDGRAEYRKSKEHEIAYERVSPTALCAFEAAGAPDPCRGGITPHHTFPKGRSGSEERSERVAPVVPACEWHNTWVSQDAEGIAWGESHLVTVGGRDWHLLMTDAEARALEAAHREFKPASSLSALPRDNTK